MSLAAPLPARGFDLALQERFDDKSTLHRAPNSVPKRSESYALFSAIELEAIWEKADN
jgi:hypothetical protein